MRIHHPKLRNDPRSVFDDFKGTNLYSFIMLVLGFTHRRIFGNLALIKEKFSFYLLSDFNSDLL